MTKKEFLEKAERITAQIKQNLDNKVELKENTYKIEVKTYAEVKKYNLEHDHEDEDSILVLDGDVYIDGNLDEEWINEQIGDLEWETELYGVLVTGNLYVNGDVIDDNDNEYDASLELHVLKNLTCNYIVSNDGHQYIKGDLNAKFGIRGIYNDGSLNVDGKLYTPYILASDHAMPREAEGDYIYIEGDLGFSEVIICNGIEGGTWGWQYFENSHSFFREEVLDEDGDLAFDEFMDTVRKGENPFVSSIEN